MKALSESSHYVGRRAAYAVRILLFFLLVCEHILLKGKLHEIRIETPGGPKILSDPRSFKRGVLQFFIIEVAQKADERISLYDGRDIALKCVPKRAFLELGLRVPKG
jgi:hypothetical protein